MPGISDMQYGYDANGVSAYLDQIQAIVLNEASNAVRDVSKIQQVCENEWQGIARDHFVENLQRDANHVAEQYEILYNVLVSEINSVQAAMANRDETLINN